MKILINISELLKYIKNYLKINYIEILTDENELIIELDSKSDYNKLISYLESNYKCLYEIKSDAYDLLFILIQFNKDIEIYDEISENELNEYIQKFNLNTNEYELEMSENEIKIKLNYNRIRNKKIPDESYSFRYYEYIRHNIIHAIELNEYELTYESMNYNSLINKMKFKKVEL